jgi:uncharacterized cupin superfamily protein
MLPPNVLRTADLLWHPGDAPPGFATDVLALSALPFATLGAHLERVEPGQQTAPLHAHTAEEEQFTLLAGELVVRELADGADRYREWTLRAGEHICYAPGTGLAHAFFNRSGGPAVFLALSDRQPGDVCTYPDSGKVLIRRLRQVGVLGEAHAAAAVFAARNRARRRPVDVLAATDRPPHVARDVVERQLRRGVWGTALGRAAGARRVGVNRDRLAPSAVSGPLHWHAHEEELALVLSGTPVLRQLRGRLVDGAPDFTDATEERARLQPGDAVHWAPGDPVAHQLRGGGGTDAVVLMIGTDLPYDVLGLPESGELVVRALDRRGALTRTSYWAGEGPTGAPPSTTPEL